MRDAASVDVAILTVVCVSGLGLALFFVLDWGGLEVAGAVPDPPIQDRVALVARTLRTLCVAIVGGLVGGICVFGVGGRLAMRITAATSGDAPQGLRTDAEEVVGEISLGGTVGLIVFVGVFGGIIFALLYVFLRRFLPGDARTAGALLGLVVLVVFAPLSDAINRDNPDFEILSPTWLAVLVFGALGPFGGAAIASIVERLDRGYPRLGWRFPTILAAIPLVVLALPGTTAAFIIAAVAVAALSAGSPRWRAIWSSSTAIMVGRAALLIVFLGFGVAFVGHVTDIVAS